MVSVVLDVVEGVVVLDDEDGVVVLDDEDGVVVLDVTMEYLMMKMVMWC